MGSKKRKWPFPDMFQWPRNLFSSDSKEFVALPSCSNQDGQHVHQLWPPEDDVSIAEFDVVFFHGLQRPNELETWKRTWASRTNPQDCWAQNWLPHALGGNIRVLALSYDSCPVQTENKGHIEDVSELGSNILETLVFSNRWKLGQRCGFVLVGHCFGGLIIKSLVEEANKRAYSRAKNPLDEQSKRRANKFLKNLKGIVFYAVPHAGSKLESYFQRCNSNWSNKISGVKLARFMENLKPNQSRMENLSTTFDSIMIGLRASVYAFVEGIPTKDAGYKLVEKAGAQRLAGENYYVVEDGDHFTLCNPPSKEHPSYAKLVDFLKTCQQQDSFEYSIIKSAFHRKFHFYKEPTELVQTLLRSLKGGETHIIVHGKFGVGKTALVEYVMQKYAMDLDDTFPGGVFQMKYGHDCDIIASQGELLRQLMQHGKVGVLQTPSCRSIPNMLQEHLNNLHENWLLVVDDVWSSRLIIESPIPRNTGSRLLITSRFPLKELPAIRIKVDEWSNNDLAAKLLASKAANDPEETTFPKGCEDVARKILKKCSGCMLAVSIFGSILSNTPKNESAWKKVYAQFKYYASAEEYTPYDYNGTIFAAIDLSLDHDKNKMFSKDLMWNVLQALSLFPSVRNIPSCVVKLAWKSMQPEGKTEYFEAVVNSLIHKNLVDGSAYGYLRLHNLVAEYLELKKPIDLVTILCEQEGELKQGRELLTIFLSIYGKQSARAKMLLWQIGAIFDEMLSDFDFWLDELLDSDAENAILAVYQLYKATQQDAKALLRLMHGHERQALIAAQVLVLLTINAGAKNLLVDEDIENFVHLCTHNLPNIRNFNRYVEDWCKVMLKMANCNVFAKKMIRHKPLLIFIVERIQKDDEYLLKFAQILMALILCVQEIGNTSLEENVLEEDKDVMRKRMKSCVLDNTCLSHVVLYHGENSSRGTEVPFFEPKLIFEYVKVLLQHHIRDSKLIFEYVKLLLQQHKREAATFKERHALRLPHFTDGFIELLDNLVDITNGATHFVEYGCVELLFYIEEPRRNFITFKHGMRFFSHRVIFESISSTGHIRSLVSIFKHGTKEDIMNVPWVLKYLAIVHEEVALQLIIEVGVEKVVEAVGLWEDFWLQDAVEVLLKHESIAKEMILQGTICELLTRVIHQNSEVCMHVLSNLIKCYGDIVIEDLDAKGGLRLFLACYSMQPLNPTWIQLLQDMAHNKAFANKMVALGSIEMVADTLNHPMDFEHLISVAGLVRCLVEGFEDRLDILLSKICIKDLLAIHERLSLRGKLQFSFLPGAFVITKRIVMDLLASNHYKEDDFYILLLLANSHEDIASLFASLIATNDKIRNELFSEYFYHDHVQLLSAKFAAYLEKKKLKVVKFR